MDCKFINCMINKIASNKNIIKKILSKIIKRKFYKIKSTPKIDIDNEIKQKTQTIYIFLLLQLYTLKTSNKIDPKKDKIFSNLAFFKKLFNYALIKIDLTSDEKTVLLTLYSYMKKLLPSIKTDNIATEIIQINKINNCTNYAAKKRINKDFEEGYYCKNYDCCDESINSNKSKNSSESNECNKTQDIICNNDFFELPKKSVTQMVYALEIIKKFICSIENLKNQIEDLSKNLNFCDIKLINKLLQVTNIHWKHFSIAFEKNYYVKIKILDNIIIKNTKNNENNEINIIVGCDNFKIHLLPSCLMRNILISENQNLTSEMNRITNILSENVKSLEGTIRSLKINYDVATYFLSLVEE